MTLFFLTKRQMMIPLVYTLAKRDALLEPQQLKHLLEIKIQLKDCSFKKSPLKRLKLEKEVSRLFFQYFSKLENKNQITQNSPMLKILKD